MTIGEQNTLSQSFRILDGAFHDGINFFDELYPVPQREETQGRSEEYFGFWVKERRFPGDPVVIATMVAGPSGQMSWIQYRPKGFYTRKNSEIMNQRKYSVIGPHDLVGIEPRIKEFESPLSFEISDVRSIGICGMGGIGKTTLAKTVFDHYRSKFECSFFLENMRDKKYTLSHSHVLKQFLSQVSAEEYGNVDDWPSLCKSKLRIKRILIVLDDVSDLSEIESFFAGDDFLCGKGSRNIITTRDRSMLLKYGVDMIYEVGGLNSHEALKLFSLNAFKQHPPADDYLKLSRKVVEFTKGVPLALKVLGSFFYGKNIQEWEFRLQKLKSIPNQEILNKLKVSFDALDEEERKIFLDIACFFRGEKINRVKRILEGSYFPTDIGISLLTEKCLLYISNNKLQMHDLLQSMGREIVSQESKEPSKRSRLWNHEDVCHVLLKDKGSEAVEGISLDLSKIKDLHLRPKTFSKMSNLRFLKFFIPLHEKPSKVHLPLGLDSFPNKLRYIHWHGYPSMSLPSKFCLENLVELNLPYSQVQRLWKGTQILPSLKLIDLRYSRQLIETPQLSATNLEFIILEGCNRLSEATLPFRFMSKLKLLNVSGNSFEKLTASIVLLPKLQRFDVSYCRRLRSLPELPRSLAYLDAHDCWLLEDVPGSTTSFTERSFNFIFSNCFQLDMGADDSILLEAHLRVEEMAVTSPKLHKVFPSRTSASICIPGDQIPDLFTYQSMDSSISIKVPVQRHSYKCLGYALCTVISFDGYHDDGQFNVKCCLKTDNGDFNDFIGYSGGWFSGESKPRFISSDHMFLWFGWFTQEVPSVLSFGFCPVKNREHRLHSCKVIKCGVHLLYSEVEGETGFPKPACSPPFNNLSTSASECNFREVDKGQGPHSKRCRRGYLYDEAQPSGFIPCEG